MQRLRELVYGAPPITEEVLAWPLKVLVLADRPSAHADLWITRRPDELLRPGPQDGWPDGARYCPDVEAPFAKVQTYLLPCDAEALDADFELVAALGAREGRRTFPFTMRHDAASREQPLAEARRPGAEVAAITAPVQSRAPATPER